MLCSPCACPNEVPARRTHQLPQQPELGAHRVALPLPVAGRDVGRHRPTEQGFYSHNLNKNAVGTAVKVRWPGQEVNLAKTALACIVFTTHPIFTIFL